MPAEAAPAATVILLRDADPSPEVLMIERHAQSDFLPDMYVFPGGRVEEEDAALGDRVAGITPTEAAAALGLDQPRPSLAFFVAAVRETFEESGVLLARRRGKPELLDATRADALARHRIDVQSGKASFRALVLEEDLELAGDCLTVHAHWITPEFVPRRFDTFFFAALLPPGQTAHHDGIESTAHTWIRPEDALDELRAGTRQIIFPTACNLETLTGFASAAAALRASRARPVVPVLPRIMERDGKRRLVIPPEAGYPTTEELIEATRGPKPASRPR